MKWNNRKRNESWPVGVPQPCAPTLAAVAPTGEKWIYETKHDGFRLIVQRPGDQVKIITRGGYNWTERYPQIVRGTLALKSNSFTIDGERVGLWGPRRRRFCAPAFTPARLPLRFDLLEESGTDLRALFLRKDRLGQLLVKSKSDIVVTEHAEAIDGNALFNAACVERLVENHAKTEQRLTDALDGSNKQLKRLIEVGLQRTARA